MANIKSILPRKFKPKNGAVVPPRAWALHFSGGTSRA